MELLAKAAHFSAGGTYTEGSALGDMVKRLGSEVGWDDGVLLGAELGFPDMVGE